MATAEELIDTLSKDLSAIIEIVRTAKSENDDVSGIDRLSRRKERIQSYLQKTLPREAKKLKDRPIPPQSALPFLQWPVPPQ